MEAFNACYNEVMSKRWKPARRLAFLLTYLLTSYIFYSKYEGWSFFQITFFIIVTISTLGYSAPIPSDDNSRLFTIFFIFIGVAIIFTVFSAVASRGISAVEKYWCKKKRVADNYHIDDLHHKKTLYLAVFYIFIVLSVGAIFFKKVEGWTWTESFYFAVQTSTTVGYGDLTTSHSTHIFLIFYVVISVIFVTYAIKSFGSVIDHERLLKERRQKLKQMQSLDFIAELNEGKGVAKHEFVLAILTHLGVLNAEEDVDPWIKKFDDFDTDGSGILTKDELQNFFVQEAQESQQVLQQMADRQKVIVLSELIEESRQSILETVIPFSLYQGGGGDLEEGRVSMSLSLFRGSLPTFRRNSANAGTMNAADNSRSSELGGVELRTSVNPINRGMGGGPNAIRSPIKRVSATATPSHGVESNLESTNTNIDSGVMVV